METWKSCSSSHPLQANPLGWSIPDSNDPPAGGITIHARVEEFIHLAPECTMCTIQRALWLEPSNTYAYSGPLHALVTGTLKRRSFLCFSISVTTTLEHLVHACFCIFSTSNLVRDFHSSTTSSRPSS